MLNQLKLEFYKLKTFPLLYLAILLMFAAGFPYGFLKFENVLNTDAVFSYTVCDTSLLFLISVVSSYFIGADFGSRTITNELKLGYSRLSVILTRAATVYILSILLHFVYIASSIGGFSAAHGFDTSVFHMENMLWFLTVSLQLMAIQSGTVMICFAAKKPLSAISVSVIYTFLFCNALRNLVSNQIFTLSCFCFAQSSDDKLLTPCVFFAIVTSMAFLMISVLIFRKAEVK